MATCEDEHPPRVEQFSINGGALRTDNLRVELVTTVSGGPDQMRASEDRTLADAAWKSYTPKLVHYLRPDGPSRRTVYLQVRRGLEVSPAAADSILVEPPGQDHNLPLGQVVAVAKKAGWRFTAEPLNPLTRCELAVTPGAIALIARQMRSGIHGECRFTLFAGRPLAKGWVFRGQERRVARHAWCETVYTVLPLRRRSALAYDLTLRDRDTGSRRKTVSGGTAPGCSYTITRLVLRGPPGETWRNAFR